MCTTADFKNVTRTKQAITAYKIVAACKDKLTSMYSPRHRSNQPGFATSGKNRKYVIGKTHQSTFRSTPGFYCYASLDAALCGRSFSARTIIEVKIPAGTKIVEGETGYPGHKCINCERLTVVGLVQ